MSGQTKDKKLVDTFGESFAARLAGKKVTDEVATPSLAVFMANAIMAVGSGCLGFLTGYAIRKKKPGFPSIRKGVGVLISKSPIKELKEKASNKA